MGTNQSPDVVAIISACIALLSAVFAFSQARSGKKTYKLEKKLYDARNANFAIQEIENSFLYNANNEDKIYYFFKVLLSNLSDSATSITKITLELIHDDNSAFIVSCQNNTEIHPDLARLSIPNNIAPHNSISGWVVFDISKRVYETININTHYIAAEDIHGVATRKEEISIREEVVGYDL